MDIYKFIISNRGTYYQKKQEPFIRIITVYTKDGYATDVGITAKPERMKKARLVGICEERKICHLDEPKKIQDNEYDLSKGCFQLMYYLDKRQIVGFKTD